MQATPTGCDDRMQQEFGGSLLFMDVDSIPLGVNFNKVHIEEVAKCHVLLAVVRTGSKRHDEKGNRRLWLIIGSGLAD